MGHKFTIIKFNQGVHYSLICKGGGNDNNLPTLEGCAVMFTKKFVLIPPFLPNDILR